MFRNGPSDGIAYLHLCLTFNVVLLSVALQRLVVRLNGSTIAREEGEGEGKGALGGSVKVGE